jgi:phage gpG-like protein
MPNAFQIRWTIEGVPELERILFKEYKKVEDFSKPLFKSSQLILKDVETQFATEGGLSGGWQALEDTTIADRIREGFGSGPILQRTGTLRRSFKAELDKKRAVITSHGVDYYKYHQSREARTKLPRRPMLLLTKTTRQNIVQNFNEFLRFEK